MDYLKAGFWKDVTQNGEEEEDEDDNNPAFMECKLYLRSYAKAYTRYFILCSNEAETVNKPIYRRGN